MIALTLSGATYPIRHDIRAIGGVWCPDEKLYFVPIEKSTEAHDLAAKNNIDIHEVDVLEDTFAPLTPDELRAYRQAKADRKSEKYRARAVSLGAKAESLFEREHRIADMIPMGQPILCGHHSQRRHERDIERMNSIGAKACAAYQESQHLSRVADRLSAPVAIKGDAEARHEAHRQKIRESVKVGDIIFTHTYGNMEILKVNQKTLKLKGKFGNFNFDMSLCHLRAL